MNKCEQTKEGGMVKQMKWWLIVLIVWLGINVAYTILALLIGRRREKLGLRRNPWTDEWERKDE